MLKLGQVINPHLISVLNKLPSLALNVDERFAARKLLNVAQVELKDWQDLLTNFKDKIEANDQETLKDLQHQWEQDVKTHAPRLPHSIVSKFDLLTLAEESALLDVCEQAVGV